MNYMKIKYNDIANGPGCRTTLFVSGCNRHCPGCFNSETWDFNAGKPFTDKEKEDIINSMDYYHSGLTLLGGEPCEPENIEAVAFFMQEFKNKTNNKSIWVYSGFTFEQLYSLSMDNSYYKMLFLYADVLVDGMFIQDQYDISLKFKGSKNQRIIDINKMREDNIFSTNQIPVDNYIIG